MSVTLHLAITSRPTTPEVVASQGFRDEHGEQDQDGVERLLELILDGIGDVLSVEQASEVLSVLRQRVQHVGDWVFAQPYEYHIRQGEWRNAWQATFRPEDYPLLTDALDN